jgi:fumarylacetoacetase
MNPTHDPDLRSWIETANRPESDFPIQNLPFGVFRTSSSDTPRVGIAIGDMILDVSAARRKGCFTGLADAAAEACTGQTLNPLLALGTQYWSALRQRVCILLSDTSERARVQRCLVSMDEVQMQLPVAIGDYSDFYASIHHAINVGSMFRPDNPLLPNYKYVPIGYHGRASSIVVSGTPIRRPSGQTKGDTDPAPAFGPCKQLDYELEVGFFVGPGNALGRPIPIAQAEDHIFGLCLVNDWSARDIQRWEYQPLGPFLSKSFATTISPWVVTLEALEPFRCPAYARPPEDPPPLPYLDSAANVMHGGIDLTLEVFLSTSAMRANGLSPVLVSRGSFKDMYWTVAQMLTHHASNGCNLRPGDLLASGTVSGPTKESRGCLLERTWRGTEPLHLPTGETRKFLEDGDEVILRGYCRGKTGQRIGFGECRGTII